ncbi:hypothetical protein DES44_3376 [Roseateles depolymerans]|uniref:Uncharacterized protein n=1 Tax=Roseateles depolymerans TaxID=76731 RepID=A0A0U3MQB4_9BURK|nr:hypothetical protein RD2015_609 [Roseateles depolymerans]REG14879.1 hypothetical protein DES44_3376 [Roseateles depolymerans]
MMKLSWPLSSPHRIPDAVADPAGSDMGPVSVSSPVPVPAAVHAAVHAAGSASATLPAARSRSHRRLRLGLLPSALGVAILLSGCDQLGIEDPAKVAAAKEAEGKAIGGACRNAMRAIEDCYALNPKAQKAAVYDGWREMDEYMRENKLEGTRPVVAHGAASKPADSASQAEEDEPPAKSAKGEKADKAEKSDKGTKSKG